MQEIQSADGITVAIVVRNGFRNDGVNFISKADYSLQLGINSYKKGDIIKSHLHPQRSINILNFQEIVYIKEGHANVKLYDSEKNFLDSVDLSQGDLIFFVSGGHGLEILEDTRIVEVKQGPYQGKNADKVIIE